MTFISSEVGPGFAASSVAITNLNAGYFAIIFEVGSAGSAANCVWTLRTNGVSTLRTNSLIIDTVRGGSHSTILQLPANTGTAIYNESVSAGVSINGELSVRRIR